MIKLFNPNERNFNTVGEMVIEPLKLIEHKKISLNGWYIDVDLPISYKEHIVQDMLAVIQSKARLRPQAFRIKNIKYSNTILSFEAEHVMFDARDYYLVDARPTNVNAHTALNYVNDRTDKKSPFTFKSDVNSVSTAYFMDRNLLEAMTTIEERWGGNYEADNWSISLRKNIGVDRGETIMYGKNLEGFEVFEDWSNVVTRIYPVGYDGVRLPEIYIDADVSYPTPYTRRVDFETEFEDEEQTDENLIPELRENAMEHLNVNKYPKVSYEVMSNINQDLDIGDTVYVKHPLIDIETQVQEYEYNVLTKRVEVMVFGNYSRSVKKKFDTIKNQMDEIKQQTSNAEAIINHQTELINSLNKNGFVYIDDNQILILDKLPKENAKHVWRWNMGGLGFSENGIEGPFKQAWTMDGVFNTDFISAGSIMTNHLSSDVGSSLDLSSNESINAIVAGIHDGNVIPNLNGTTETYIGWDWEDSILFNHPRLVQRENLRASTNFLISKVDNSLSMWGLEFYKNGLAISPKGYIVPDKNYSFRGKRAKGNHEFAISVLEYSNDKLIESTHFFIRDKKEYIEFTIKPKSNTNGIRLQFSMRNMTNYDDPLILTEMMFNRGSPMEYKASADDVKVWAESQFTQTNNEIKSTVQEVKIVDGKVEKNTSVISQQANQITSLVGDVETHGSLITQNKDEIDLKVSKDGIIGGINASPETVKIHSSNLDFNNATGNNVNLTGKITATSGKVGGYDISGDKLVGNDVTLGSREIAIGPATLGKAKVDNEEALKINAYYLELGDETKSSNWIRIGGRQFLQGFTDSGYGIFVRGVVPDRLTQFDKYLGTADNRWDNIYLKNQPNVSSDSRIKNNINDIPQDLINRFMELQPKQYTQNGQVHFGYIAQDVEQIIFKYLTSVNKYNNVRELNEDVKRYAVLHKDETFLSLLYGEITVLKDAYYRNKIKQLENDVIELKKKPKVSKGFRKRSGK